MKPDEIISIGAFQFDRVALILKDNLGSRVALRSQSAEVLRYLILRNGAIVAKEELIESVWPDTFVTDDSLVQCIADIRRALGDTDHEFVQTFPKKGYRLNNVEASTEMSPAKPALRLIKQRWLSSAIVLIFVFIGYIAFFRTSETPMDINTVTIAVLPFDDFSAGPDKGYLSDAIAEGITTELAGSKVFSVIARNSSFIYRATDKDMRQIGEELGVQYILEGSQQKNGSDLRVNVQLIDAATAKHIWAHVYDVEIGDLFIVQEQIIRTVANRVGLRILERPLPLSDPDKVTALHLYMEGIAIVRKDFSATSTARTRELAMRAIEIDPDSAFGYLNLAWTYRHDATFGWNGLDREEALTLAEENAEQALQIAPDNYDAHYVRARIHVERNQLEQANIRFSRAIELNPSASNVINASAEPLLYVGRTQEAIERIRQAMGIDPFHQEHFHWQMSWALWENNECVEAEAAMRKMANIPSGAQRMLAGILACQGKIDEAREALTKFLSNSSQSTLSAERERYEELWTAPGSLDRWIEHLRLAGMPE